MLLQIEIKKSHFEESNKDINLLFIEEPEAHTHPQMQYVFIEKIKVLLQQISHLQTMISSHSSHIVNKCDFREIRYFLKLDNDEIEIKNFYSELEKKYQDEQEQFKFLQQYLTLNSSELFFAEKIIFIEGTTEKLLLPLFIKQLDDKNTDIGSYTPLSSQNISILEVGANAKAFRHFLNFLGIKTLIITDIDTTKLESTGKQNKSGEDIKKPKACSVIDGASTSNYSIKYYLESTDLSESEWMEKLKNNELNDDQSKTKVAYQIEDDGYHGRSFEDAFISVNFEEIKKKKGDLQGLQNIKQLDEESPDFYSLTDQILKNKSEFASSLLWLGLTEKVEWKTPKYIEEGLLWISKK